MEEDLKRMFAAAIGCDPEKLPLVLDIEVAGKAAEMSRSRAYVAAANGSMPTIMIGNRKKVPTLRWFKILSGE